MNTPTPLSDEEIVSLVPVAPGKEVHDFARAIEQATNQKWQEMLSKQEPVAYFDLIERKFQWTAPMSFEQVSTVGVTPPLYLFTHPSTTHTALLRQALEALETCIVQYPDKYYDTIQVDAAIEEIKRALK